LLFSKLFLLTNQLKIKNMQLRQSERKRAKIKMALQGSAGSGKTYSSLLLAHGLCGGDFSKVAIIDTENGSADLYAHLGNYNVVTLYSPFTTESYLKAIDMCERAGMEVIIIDSISHCWDYLLDYHASLAGNSFTNWSKVTPLLKSLTDKILQSDAHIIATMRTKQDYVLNQKDGKYVPEKVGLKAVQRDGIDYEFTIVFDVDIKHFAVSSKDRTDLFMGKTEFIINSATGRKILDWCNSGTNLEDARNKIKNSETLEELRVLYQQYQNWRELLEYDFKIQKDTINAKELLLNPKNFNTNGATNH
jgi:hypothetical protein